MKLQFDAGLAYQERAVASVVELFEGQPRVSSGFEMSAYGGQIGLFDSGFGIGNRLELGTQEVFANLRRVQERNCLPDQTCALSAGEGGPALDFDVEMETGTGKTYVYLRTVFELHKQYGFSKFVIVVPGLAVREGVYKTLEITEEHFKNLYGNTAYSYFVYDGRRPEQVRSFAADDCVSIMLINIEAFRRSFQRPEQESRANVIHRANDRLDGMRPIELIRQTRPVVVIDEPQSVDTTPLAKEAVASLQPLFVLRYSATHVERHSLVYRLDAVDSFKMGLVKGIEVAGVSAGEGQNRAYVKLVSADPDKKPVRAVLEIYAAGRGGVKRRSVTVSCGDDLYERSGRREIYRGCLVEEISCQKGAEAVAFTNGLRINGLGKSVGGAADGMVLKEWQIRRTIEEHLDRELRLLPLGIKVLSLFFIDRVANYRSYDRNGRPRKGIYARMFEKHYAELSARPKYRPLFLKNGLSGEAAKVHGGYFSQDKLGRYKDTGGRTAADEDAYTLIMREKEKLLSFDTKLRFLFSHSALREGWDNPNVFQICTLNETKSGVKKRQEIGRGLRLCVDRDGKRRFGRDINVLTVMANESYEEFAASLQQEYEQDGVRFDRSQIRNREEKRNAGLRGACLESPEFHELWGKICPKTGYSIEADRGELARECVRDIRERFALHAERLLYTKASLEVTREGIGARETDRRASALTGEGAFPADIHAYPPDVNTYLPDVDTYLPDMNTYLPNVNTYLPDVLSYLQAGTGLTRRTIGEILIKSGTLRLFLQNPQLYMEEMESIINETLRRRLPRAAVYTPTGERYEAERFVREEPSGYPGRNMLASGKSVYRHILYESAVEREFAERLEDCARVRLYLKLPDWYKIPTPAGFYTPDWAVAVETDGGEKLRYYVLETKGSISREALRPLEEAKIRCAKKHFKALGGVRFEAADDFNRWIEGVE